MQAGCSWWLSSRRTVIQLLSIQFQFMFVV